MFGFGIGEILFIGLILIIGLVGSAGTVGAALYLLRRARSPLHRRADSDVLFEIDELREEVRSLRSAIVSPSKESEEPTDKDEPSGDRAT